MQHESSAELVIHEKVSKKAIVDTTGAGSNEGSVVKHVLSVREHDIWCEEIECFGQEPPLVAETSRGNQIGGVESDGERA